MGLGNERSVVTDAYTLAEDVALPDGEIHMHDIHAFSLSWRAFSLLCSIADLMAAAFWCSTHTFTIFHLQDLSEDTFDLCALGPLVVAQAVVPVHINQMCPHSDLANKIW